MNKPPIHILHANVQKVYFKKAKWWRLSEPASIPCASGIIVAPAGYESDYASKPWWVPDWLIPRSGLSAMPSMGHDYLCENGIVPRAEADRVFLHLLEQAGVPVWQRYLMYSYVRAFGWVRYKKN